MVRTLNAVIVWHLVVQKVTVNLRCSSAPDQCNKNISPKQKIHLNQANDIMNPDGDSSQTHSHKG